MNDVHETAHIAGVVGRQIAGDVDIGVVFLDLIAGRREESDKKSGVGVTLFQFLYQRFTLLILAKRGSVQPDDRLSGALFSQQGKSGLAAAMQQTGFLIEKRCPRWSVSQPRN